MKELVDFKQQSPPKRRTSRLKSFKNEILELYDEGYRVEQIQEFLAQNNIHVTPDAINKFKRNLSTKNFTLKTPDRNAVTKNTQTESKVANEPNGSKAMNALLKKMQKTNNMEIEE